MSRCSGPSGTGYCAGCSVCSSAAALTSWISRGGRAPPPTEDPRPRRGATPDHHRRSGVPGRGCPGAFRGPVGELPGPPRHDRPVAREFSRRRRGRRSRPPGRPPLDPSIKHLIVRLGRENSRWGYLRIRGELLKLGIDVSATTIAAVLRRSGLGPGAAAPRADLDAVPEGTGVRPALARVPSRGAGQLGRPGTGSSPRSTDTGHR